MASPDSIFSVRKAALFSSLQLFIYQPKTSGHYRCDLNSSNSHLGVGQTPHQFSAAKIDQAWTRVILGADIAGMMRASLE
jgi:hypothetical protein